MASDVQLSPYFERIGFAGSIAPTLATLEALHGLHPAAIPFENLNPLLGLPVRLDQPSLHHKLIVEHRGGYCFEHNTLFMRVLRELEFPVRCYAARVLWGHEPDAERPISHMVLGVDIAGATYLTDVGFGGLSLTAPLRLRADVEQETPHETFRLLNAGDGYRLEVQLEGEWKPVYQFDLVERSDAEYAEFNERIAADHAARLLLVAARAGKDVRYNLFRNRLTIHRPGVERERRDLADIDAIKDALANVFGIALPPGDILDPMLAKVVEAAREQD